MAPAPKNLGRSRLLEQPAERVASRRTEASLSTDPATQNLAKIEHIVVLMLENRSFDHMLGYLSLEGGRSDVEGLKPGITNTAGGQEYPVAHLTATHVPDPRWDPDHSSKATDLQIGGGKMDGFAESYRRTLIGRQVANPDPGPVMGYYHAADLPVYDELAKEFSFAITGTAQCRAQPGRTGFTR